MKLAIIGSRDFINYELLRTTLDSIPTIELIVSGGAKGADSLAGKYAREKGIPVKIFTPDWKMGRHAGLIRNKTIIDHSDQIIAFWDGHSRGTKDSLDYARTKKKPIKVILFPGTLIKPPVFDEHQIQLDL